MFITHTSYGCSCFWVKLQDVSINTSSDETATSGVPTPDGALGLEETPAEHLPDAVRYVHPALFHQFCNQTLSGSFYHQWSWASRDGQRDTEYRERPAGFRICPGKPNTPPQHYGTYTLH